MVPASVADFTNAPHPFDRSYSCHAAFKPRRTWIASLAPNQLMMPRTLQLRRVALNFAICMDTRTGERVMHETLRLKRTGKLALVGSNFRNSERYEPNYLYRTHWSALGGASRLPTTPPLLLAILLF